MTTAINPLPLHAQSPPLRADIGGVIRVDNTRVSLDVVVEQYENGMTPEQIVSAYDSLELANVYGAIAYYLQHRDDVREYLTRRKQEAAELQAKIEALRPRASRSELAARHA